MHANGVNKESSDMRNEIDKILGELVRKEISEAQAIDKLFSLFDVSKRTSLESKNNIILDINQWTQILLANRKTIRERPLWAMIADINNRTTD